MMKIKLKIQRNIIKAKETYFHTINNNFPAKFQRKSGINKLKEYQNKYSKMLKFGMKKKPKYQLKNK